MLIDLRRTLHSGLNIDWKITVITEESKVNKKHTEDLKNGHKRLQNEPKMDWKSHL